jgi:hypothetical protein
VSESKGKYTSPEITEVKFEDKNLVTFFVCSKQTRIEGDSSSGCCELVPDQVPNRQPFDPS